MARQKSPTQAFCWHGGWQVLKELSPHKWMSPDAVCEKAAKQLPQSVWDVGRSRNRVPRDVPENIKKWVWMSLGTTPDLVMPLGFVTRNDDGDWKLTPQGASYMKSHEWEEYEPIILEWNHRRASLYRIRGLSTDGVREVAQLAIGELAQREPIT